MQWMFCLTKTHWILLRKNTWAKSEEEVTRRARTMVYHDPIFLAHLVTSSSDVRDKNKPMGKYNSGPVQMPASNASKASMQSDAPKKTESAFRWLLPKALTCEASIQCKCQNYFMLGNLDLMLWTTTILTWFCSRCSQNPIPQPHRNHENLYQNSELYGHKVAQKIWQSALPPKSPRFSVFVQVFCEFPIKTSLF